MKNFTFNNQTLKRSIYKVNIPVRKMLKFKYI